MAGGIVLVEPSLWKIPGSSPVKPRLREVNSLALWLYCFLASALLQCSDKYSRDHLVYARLMIREAQHHGSQGWIDYDGVYCQQAALDLSLQCNALLRLPHNCLFPQMAVRVCLLIVAHFAQFAKKLIIQQLPVHCLISINHKVVATDFEVVRPGSGCGLFNVGVVCFMYVWSVKCRCGFLCLILC